MNTDQIFFQTGLPEQLRSSAVSLYDEAFGKKISAAVQSDEDRQHLLNSCLIPEYAIVAVSADELIGIAGLHTPDGSFTGGIGYRDLISQLGLMRGNRAALIFSLYERKPKPG